MPAELTDDLDIDKDPDAEPVKEPVKEPDKDPDAEPKLDDKTQKRIDDLISARDKEIARANKAEEALKAGKAKEPGSNDPGTAALMQELREASLDAVYGEFPELKKYSIDRGLIDGSTRAEMRESATSVVSLIKSLSTKVRNEVLAEHGLKAEPAGSTRTPPPDYGSMSEEDFKKLLDSIS